MLLCRCLHHTQLVSSFPNTKGITWVFSPYPDKDMRPLQQGNSNTRIVDDVGSSKVRTDTKNLDGRISDEMGPPPLSIFLNMHTRARGYLGNINAAGCNKHPSFSLAQVFCVTFRPSSLSSSACECSSSLMRTQQLLHVSRVVVGAAGNAVPDVAVLVAAAVAPLPVPKTVTSSYLTAPNSTDATSAVRRFRVSEQPREAEEEEEEHTTRTYRHV